MVRFLQRHKQNDAGSLVFIVGFNVIVTLSDTHYLRYHVEST